MGSLKAEKVLKQHSTGIEASAEQKQLTTCALAIGVIAAGQGALPMNTWIDLTFKSAAYEQTLTTDLSNIKILLKYS